MTEKQHYPLSPSASGRWLKCGGSLELANAAPPETPSQYAEEGTAAHTLAESMIVRPETLTEVEYDPEMWQAATIFAEYCQGIIAGLPPGDNWHAEKEIASQEIEGLGGTCDFLAFNAETSHLHIADFKYGAGVSVHAEKNTQLLCYAVLAVEWLTLQEIGKVETATLAIVQPRTGGEPIDEWVVSAKEITQFKATLKTARSSTSFQAGEHCRWCPALTVCDEVANRAFELARLEFDDLNSRLFELYTLKPAIESLLDQVPGRMLSAMQQGQSFPGLKAVQTYGNRTWIADEDTTLATLRKKKIKISDATVRKLKSPTQLEKLIDKELVASLCHRPERGLAIVPESDKRTAIEFAPAASEFDDLTFLT